MELDTLAPFGKLNRLRRFIVTGYKQSDFTELKIWLKKPGQLIPSVTSDILIRNIHK
jgi:hypothetical protein